MKVLIILIFGAYLMGAGYGLTQIKEGLERRKLAKNDSYSVKFFDLEDDYYREFPYRMQVLIAGEMNYSDPVSRRAYFFLIAFGFYCIYFHFLCICNCSWFKAKLNI